jgi:hypothetical protein
LSVNLQDLIDAVEDLATEVRDGQELDQRLINSISADYDLVPSLVERKFHQRYPRGVGTYHKHL